MKWALDVDARIYSRCCPRCVNTFYYTSHTKPYEARYKSFCIVPSNQFSAAHDRSGNMHTSLFSQVSVAIPYDLAYCLLNITSVSLCARYALSLSLCFIRNYPRNHYLGNDNHLGSTGSNFSLDSKKLHRALCPGTFLWAHACSQHQPKVHSWYPFPPGLLDLASRSNWHFI